MKKIINYIKTNRLKSIIGLGVILSLIVVVISISFANPDPNYKFSIISDDVTGFRGGYGLYENNTPYTFKLTKSMEWINRNKVKVTLNIDSNFADEKAKDVLLVVDTSSYLDSEELDNLKSHLSSAADKILHPNITNTIGIVSFNNSYNTYDFSSDINQVNSNINSLIINTGRSYYSAFKGVEELLSNYTFSDNRDLKIIFITTGKQTLRKAQGLYEYEKLKSMYPSIKFDSIYYYTNNYVIPQTNNDMFNKELTAMEDDLEKKVETLAFDAPAYEDFIITDHYDTNYFLEEDITNNYSNNKEHVNVGEVEKNTNGTLVWKLGSSNVSEIVNSFYTGMSAKLEYELDTSEIGDGNYSLNPTGIGFDYYDGNMDVGSDTTITDSLVVGNSYNVTYNSNAPSGCTPSGSFGSSHKDVYEAVQHPSDPTCSGYKFKGWKVVTEGVNKSQNGFIMPPKNVEVKATWSKVSIVKSMGGDVKEVPKAYDLFKEEAEKTNGVIKDYDTFFAGQGFAHQDAYDGSGDKKIYFFRAANKTQANTILNMNNVIFANHCWQMLRTTDTGGIKMIYNGEPAIGETGHEECQTNRGGHIGYNAATRGDTLTIASGTVYYGSDYTYDSTNNVFSLAGTIISSSSWATDYNNLIGKYTCNSTSQNGTCSTLYLIESYNSNTVANALKLEFIATATGVYSQFGEVPFNRVNNSPADVGYMYNTTYERISKSLGTTSYYFGSDYSYDYNTLTGEYEYSLTGEVLKDYTGDITTTHYTCWQATAGGKCSQLSYVYYHEANSKTMYYINLSDGKGVEDALSEMLNNDNVNVYDSTIKLAVDKWYEHYILPYPEFTSKLEDTVFCNDRSISNLGGWSSTGTQNVTLLFKNNTVDNNLNCSNLTDRFSADTNNTKAHLTYPVGLMSAPEMNLLNRDDLRKTGVIYWLVSPYHFYSNIAYERRVSYAGGIDNYIGYSANGVRPSVSLATGTKFTSGDGSMSNPYRVD